MKQYVISYLNFPVTDISSYGYVKAINKSEGTAFDLRLTNDPKNAQKFGAEASEVAGWLANMTDANMAFRVLEFEAKANDVEPQCQTSGFFYISRETRAILGHTGAALPGVNCIEYYLGKDITDRSKLIDHNSRSYDYREGEVVTQVQRHDETIICATTLLIKFV